jgi:hypothetical protein
MLVYVLCMLLCGKSWYHVPCVWMLSWLWDWIARTVALRSIMNRGGSFFPRKIGPASFHDWWVLKVKIVKG